MFFPHSLTACAITTETEPAWMQNVESEDDVIETVTDSVVNDSLSSSVSTNVIGSGTVDTSYGGGIIPIISAGLFILTVGVVIAGIAGMTIFAIRWITAGTNAEVISIAKKRLIQIVVGLGVYSFAYAALSFTIPAFSPSGTIFSESQKQEIFESRKQAIINERLAYYREHTFWYQDENNHWRVRDKTAYFENDKLNAGGDTGAYDVAHEIYEQYKDKTSKTDYLIAIDQPQLYVVVFQKNSKSSNANDKWKPVRGFNITDCSCPWGGTNNNGKQCFTSRATDGELINHGQEGWDSPGYYYTEFQNGAFHTRAEETMGKHGITNNSIAPASAKNAKFIHDLPLGTRVLINYEGQCK